MTRALAALRMLVGTSRGVRRTSALPIVIAIGVVLAGPVVPAQGPPDPTRYREYALGSTVESVRLATALPAADVRTLHERPSRIQELEWRVPYVLASDASVDPVRAIAFAFCDDALYRIVVDYDRERTDGLTDSDLVESVSAVYGHTAALTPRGQPTSHPDQAVLAQWSTAASIVTLLRGVYSPGVQLVLVSPSVSARARRAIAESIRLDRIEAPQRNADQRSREIADEAAAREKQRTSNKATFRP